MLPLDLTLYLIVLLTGYLYGIIHYPNLNTPSRLLTQLLGFVFIAEIINVVLAYTIRYNLFVSYFLALVQLYYYYKIYQVLFSSKRIKALQQIGLVITAIGVFLSTVLVYKFEGHPSSVSALLALFIVLSSLLLFMQMLKYPNKQSIFKEFGFWFGLGSLIFFSFTFFIFATYQNFLVNETLDQPSWAGIIAKASNFILYGSYLVALIITAQSKRISNEP